MHTCKPEESDVIIDGKAYRLEMESELSIIEKKLSGKKGIAFPNPRKTMRRLKKEKEARQAARHLELYT